MSSASSIFETMVYIYGQVMPASRAGVSALDRGFLYGDCLFETLKTIDRVPIFANEHIERMLDSAGALKYSNVPSPREIRDALAKLIGQCQLGDLYIRIMLSRGRGSTNPRLKGTYRPVLVIIARDLKPYPAQWYQEGIRVALAPWRRSKSCPISRHKTCNYLDNILAQDAVSPAADEALFLNTDGEVAECASSNIFCVTGNRLTTPDLRANLLPGIIRRKLLDLGPQLGLETEEKIVLPLDVFAADEVFVTNSLMGIMPVRLIEGHQPRRVKEGTGWPQTLKLIEALHQQEMSEVARAAKGG